jgi:hypothetical protein
MEFLLGTLIFALISVLIECVTFGFLLLGLAWDVLGGLITYLWLKSHGH